MEPNNKLKNERNPLIRILLYLSLIILMGIGGFSLYKIIIKKTNITKDEISYTINPTKPADVETSNEQGLPSPTPLVTISAIDTITPTKIPTPSPKISITAISPTKIPSLTPTNKPTNTPTQTLSPSRYLSPTVTQTPKENLPVSGIPGPTILLFSLGLILILPVILLY